ncbi:imidazoleglycerol-phosphate dehydratase [Aureococcus anophagefferens]|uniref:imidazoleglycerol-phosphate dehydratase n=2 Tax=Aureococcus anophagefferens TaxID=44056 RepID=A0ABR1FZT2_AURAN
MSDASTDVPPPDDASTDIPPPDDVADESPPADRRTSMRTMKFTPGADTDRQWHESYDWRVGDACAALWSGDGMFYPAVIVAVNRLSRRRVDYVVEYKDGVAEKLRGRTPRRRRKTKLVRFEDDGAPDPEEGGDSARRGVLSGDAAGAPKLETVAAEVAEVVAKARRGGERARRLSAGEAASSDDEWSAEAPTPRRQRLQAHPRGSPSAPGVEADGSPTKKRLCRADEDFIESHQEIRDAAKRACKVADANKSFFRNTLLRASVTPGFLASTVEETPRLATGVPALDDVLSTFAEHAGILVAARCAGDRYIDDHHTAEDVAITVGQCLCDALGDKAGLTRMASADRERDGVEVRAVLDLSNRPNFHSDLAFDEEYLGGDAAADAGDGECGAVLSSEMLVHALESLTLETRATLHLEGRRDAGGEGHTRPLALAAAAAYGAALGQTIRIDPRRKGAVASSKGTLSK